MAVLKDRARADHDGALHEGAGDLRAGLDDNGADQHALVVDLALHAAFDAVEEHLVALQDVLDAAGVLPVPAVLLGPDGRAVGHQPLDGVGDLQLAARARHDRVDGLVDGWGEEVDADERQVGARHRGLLDEPLHDARRVHLGHAERARVLDLGDEHLGGRTQRVELGGGLGDALGEHVVAEVHHEVVVAEEVLGELHALGEALGALLRDVRDLDAEPGPVAERLGYLLDVVADDDPDLGDTEVADVVEHPLKDGLVGDRDELLGHGVAERAQSASRTAAQNQSLHGVLFCRGCVVVEASTGT